MTRRKNSKLSVNLAIFGFLLSIIISHNAVLCDSNDTTTQRDRHKDPAIHNYHNIVVRNINVTESIFPYFAYKAVYAIDGTEEEACESPSAIDDFPSTIFSEEALRHGAVVFHFVAAIYFLTLLTLVCGHYFIPSVECICEDLHLSADVAAATFMATATTMPEFFTNTISTFVTDSDLGIGAIIGSMLFNVLGVAGCGALAAKKPIQLDWWPVSRDSLLFSFNVSLLVFFASDGEIQWYEATTFVVLYFVYFVIMFQNRRIMGFFKPLIEDNFICCRNKVFDVSRPDSSANHKVKVVENNNVEANPNGHINNAFVISKEDLNAPPTATPEDKGAFDFHHSPIIAPHVVLDEEDEEMKLFTVSRQSISMTIWWYYTWPLRVLLTCLIPNPRRYRKLYPITFIMCMIVLAANSYMVVWMVTVIGFTFNIPEAVMGLTFLGAGGCLPEAASAIIMGRKGDGALGVSNSLGSNTLAILFSLGFPWFLRTMVDMAMGQTASINIYNKGIEFTILLILFATIALYIIISCTGYRLKRMIGASLLGVYVCFVTFGILMSMGFVFGSMGNPC